MDEKKYKQLVEAYHISGTYNDTSAIDFLIQKCGWDKSEATLAISGKDKLTVLKAENERLKKDWGEVLKRALTIADESVVKETRIVYAARISTIAKQILESEDE